jgi:hypothetical protein
MKFSRKMRHFNRDNCLIEMTIWAGLTVNVSSKKKFFSVAVQQFKLHYLLKEFL